MIKGLDCSSDFRLAASAKFSFILFYAYCLFLKLESKIIGRNF